MSQPIKTVAIIQHTPVGQPGQVLAVLDALQIPWTLFSLPNGDQVPKSIDAFSGLITLGGGMSANDDLDWLNTEKALIVDAFNKGVPISGHCLGSQIMSKALGAKISKNSVKEIGWLKVEVKPENRDQALQWFGDIDQGVPVFQWHGDTFELPPGAVPLLTSSNCKNQAYVLDNKHMAMQFHLEMTPHLVNVSLAANGHEIKAEREKESPSVNSVDEVLQGVSCYMPAMHNMLEYFYSQWVKNLKTCAT